MLDAESSGETQELSGYGSDATATTLPLTPRAGDMQKGPRRDCPVGEVDKSCRWSKRGSGKCRGPAPKAKATSEVMDFVAVIS